MGRILTPRPRWADIMAPVTPPQVLLLDLDGTLLDHDTASRAALLAAHPRSGRSSTADPLGNPMLNAQRSVHAACDGLELDTQMTLLERTCFTVLSNDIQTTGWSRI